MPIAHRKSDSSEMDPDASPGCRLSGLSRGGSLESQSSSSGTRSVSLDDESLKHLTHEEKDVILFFEETIGSLEDDFEEPVLCDGGGRCHSPPSLEEHTSSPAEPEDVIDLVQPTPGAGDAACLPEGTWAAASGLRPVRLPRDSERGLETRRRPGCFLSHTEDLRQGLVQAGERLPPSLAEYRSGSSGS
ncbi:proline and serine-rich protein 2 [Carlito syrichta]|uniref:Proline and serine-rich protein 2 n=1 Tax=Carlito syrichta TaxID=1868482 RepID=A0A3Q0EB81_CARSF|nr:proline and serine-rich protein 2 [Carlito syrichta]